MSLNVEKNRCKQKGNINAEDISTQIHCRWLLFIASIVSEDHVMYNSLL